jgi:predicted lipoprotein
MLSAGELAQRRADYALAVAKQVQKQAQALHMAWQPSGGNFARELAKAGDGSATFASAQAALNSVSDGLFYLEKEVKDYKLGWPLGLVPECLTATCPEAVEAPYARISNRQIVRNLVGFRRLFQGCGSGYTGLGFDDWLEQVGASDLLARMLEALSASEDQARDMDPPIERAIVSDTAKVSALHARLKILTDLMKTEFVSVLNLEPPAGVEGDND